MKELIEQQIGFILPDQCRHFVLDGTWSLFELLDYILDQIGPSELFISSFSISEAAICAFQHLIEHRSILDLRVLLDASNRKTKTPLLFFLENVGAELRLTLNHSKVMLFKNDHWAVVCNASANMSRNRRIETLVIDTNLSVYNFYRSTFDELFDNAVPFLP